jgi:DNA processing protein
MIGMLNSEGEPLVSERAFWVAWSQISGVGPVLLKRLSQHFPSLAAAWQATASELSTVEGIGPQIVEAILAGRSRLQPEAVLETHERDNPGFWTPADPDYPRLLREIPDPPPVLYYRGQVRLEENQGLTPAIGIVGTRDPSDYGRRWTRKLSSAIARQGFTVVSGLADGIDAEAHQSCLSIGGRTIAVVGTGVDVVYPWRNRPIYEIAVVGTGVDVVYPWRNRPIYEQMLESGLILSEYPASTQPDRGHFPRRNRIIAGLSRAVIVMEAPSKSGALITAHLANDYGRDIYVLPGGLDNPRSLGCLKLLQTGAQVILSEIHMLEMLGTMPHLQVVESPASAADQLVQAHIPDLAPDLLQVLQALTAEPTPFDTIVQKVGLAAAAVSSALLQLELLGLVSQEPGMRYQLC